LIERRRSSGSLDMITDEMIKQHLQNNHKMVDGEREEEMVIGGEEVGYDENKEVKKDEPPHDTG